MTEVNLNASIKHLMEERDAYQQALIWYAKATVVSISDERPYSCDDGAKARFVLNQFQGEQIDESLCPICGRLMFGPEKNQCVWCPQNSLKPNSPIKKVTEE